VNRLRGTFLLLTAFAHTTFAAEAGMRLTIPHATHPPTLDGKLAPGEWDDAAAVTGIINQFDGVAHPRQATFWLKYDDGNMYVAQRSTLLAGEKNTATALTVELNGQRHNVPLAAGEHTPWSTTAEAASNLTLSVSDATGHVLYRQQIPVRAGYGRDRMAFVPDVWFGGRPKMCASVVVPLPVYNPIHNLLWARVSLQGRPELDKQRTGGNVSVRRAGEPQPFARYPMSTDVNLANQLGDTQWAALQTVEPVMAYANG